MHQLELVPGYQFPRIHRYVVFINFSSVIQVSGLRGNSSYFISPCVELSYVVKDSSTTLSNPKRLYLHTLDKLKLSHPLCT